MVIEFELAMFGTSIYLLPFPLFLLALKALNKKIIFIAHQVLPEMGEIAPHIDIDPESFRSDIMNALNKMFYAFILAISNKVIVFEEVLKTRLLKLPFSQKKQEKIVVIPHGIEKFNSHLTKYEARKKLKISQKKYIVMSFGFLAWYKGTDWLIGAVKALKEKKKDAKIQLVLAGGPNPNHNDQEYYSRYIKGIKRACGENDFLLTGFVPEKQIPLYFSAADVVVFPYRTFMSSSGPLSLALSFKKPFLLSQHLSEVLESDDVKEIISKYHLKQDDLIFNDFNGDFGKKLIKMKKDQSLQNKVSKLARDAQKSRSWKIIGQKYYQELVN